ncbi:MAG: cytochrome c [Oligoflexales bacterium]
MKNLLKKLFTGWILISSSSAFAGNEHAREYREKVMSAVGAHMKSLSLILKQKDNTALHKHISKHTANMDELAAISQDIFSFDSKDAKGSKTKSKAWDEKTKSLSDGFKKELSKFQEATKKAAELTKSNDISKLKPALGVLGKSCKSCHDSYKEKD